MPMLALLACVTLPPPVARTDQVAVRVLVDEDWMGVRFDMAPGWHIYWVNPGESGMATSIEGAGPVHYPGPERFKSPGDITNYGWDDHVVLLVEPPERITTVQIEWLACREICVLQNATVQVDPGLVNATLSQHVDALPRPVGELEITRDGDGLLLEADDFFPDVETEANLLAMDAKDGLLRLQVSGPLSGVARAKDTFYAIEVP